MDEPDLVRLAKPRHRAIAWIVGGALAVLLVAIGAGSAVILTRHRATTSVATSPSVGRLPVGRGYLIADQVGGSARYVTWVLHSDGSLTGSLIGVSYALSYASDGHTIDASRNDIDISVNGYISSRDISITSAGQPTAIGTISADALTLNVPSGAAESKYVYRLARESQYESQLTSIDGFVANCVLYANDHGGDLNGATPGCLAFFTLNHIAGP